MALSSLSQFPSLPQHRTETGLVNALFHAAESPDTFETVIQIHLEETIGLMGNEFFWLHVSNETSVAVIILIE